MPTIVGITKLELLLRRAAGLDMDKNDRQRLSDFINHKIYDLLRRTQMESQQRTHLLETLMEEARQMITVLVKASAAHDTQATAQETAISHEQYSLEDERHYWKAVLQHLTETRQALDHIKECEQRRGVGA